MCTEGAQLDGAWARPPHPNGMEHDRTHKCDIARSPVVSTENRADTAGRGEPLRNAPFGTVNPSAEAYTGSNPVPATLSGPSIGRAFCVRTGIILAVGGLVGLTVAMGSKLGADAC